MQKHLALYMFGVFAAPADNPANDGFHALDAEIWTVLDKATGLVARSGYDGEDGPPSWGEQVFPSFYHEKGDGYSPSTLSLWLSIEHALAFSYHGLHKQALRRGREWMVHPAWPPYAAWWVDAGTRPEWQDAVSRHKHLHEHGPSATAFLFRKPFGPNGTACAINTRAVTALAKANQLVLAGHSSE